MLLSVLLLLSVANVVLRVGPAARSPLHDGAVFETQASGPVLIRASGALAAVPLGARLVAVDGQVMETSGQVARVLETHRRGDVLTYELEASGSNLSVRVSLTGKPMRRLPYVPLFALSLLFWLAAIVALLRGPVPAGFVPLSASLFAILAFSYSGILDPLDLAFYALDSLGRLALGPAALLCAMAAAQRPGPRGGARRALAALSIPAAVFLALSIAAGLGASLPALVGLLDRLLLISAAIPIAASTILLASTLKRQSVPPASRDQVRYTYAAFAFGLLPFAITTLLPIALAPDPAAVSIAGAGFLLLCPITLSRAADAHARRTARRALESYGACALASGALGAVAALAGCLLAIILPARAAPPMTAALLAAASIAAVALASRTERRLRRLRLGRRAPLQDTLQAFAEELLPLREATRIANLACERLCHAFALSGATCLRDGRILGGSGDAPRHDATRLQSETSVGKLCLLLGPDASGEEIDERDRRAVAAFALHLFRAVENALLFRALEEKSRLNAQVIAASPAGMVRCAADGTVVEVNARLCEHSRTSPEAARGLPIARLLPPRVLEAVRAPHAGPVRVELDAPDRHRVLDVARTELPDGYLVTVTDVTLQATIDAALRERERLSQLGSMTAQVAHDVATPLTGVSSYAQMLSGRVEDPELRAIARRIQEEAERCSAITRGVLARARGEKVEPGESSFDVAAVVRDLAATLAPLFSEARVSLQLSVDAAAEGTVRVRGTRTLLQQLLVNLLLNAKEASPAEATVTMEVAAAPAERIVRVRDRGPGIAPEALDRIFDPFYTTKETGTGLGLYVARRLASEMGGSLSVESVPGAGTTMTLRLPEAD